MTPLPRTHALRVVVQTEGARSVPGAVSRSRPSSPQLGQRAGEPDPTLPTVRRAETGWVADSRAAPSREWCAGGDVSTLTAAAPIDAQVLDGRAEPQPWEARAR